MSKSELGTPKKYADINKTVDKLFKYVYDMKETYDYMFRHIDNNNIVDSSLSFDKLSGGSIDLTGEVTITGEKETTILDEFGLDVRFIK